MDDFWQGDRFAGVPGLTSHSTPINRKPLDIDDAAHEYLDNLFLKKFGHSNVCWSTDVEDLFNAVDTFTENLGKDFSYIRDDPQVLDDVLIDYRTGDLSNAAYSGNELMFACERYFLYDYKSSSLPGDFLHNSVYINT